MGANIIEDRKRKKAYGPKSNPSKKRFNGNCYNCGKAGHRSADCRTPKKDKKKAFATYALVGAEETLSIENSATAKIERSGKIFMKMTSGKVVTLNNALHVPEIRKNLVSTGLLVKN
uniref:CCHC-type domain-containing protein n=1 Tax=Nicotiana tabacum TaxID=4097 RepID=A0A1S4DPX2_TOBAC